MLIRCTEKIGFFSEMINNQEADKHEECCKAMNYKFGKPGEIIFKEGSIGETFYIILKGSVGIFKESSDTPLATFNIKDDNNSLKIRKKSALLLTPSNPQLKSSNSRLKENQTNNDNNTNENINKIKILKAGEAFGELSLIDGRPRAATVICEQECHLAILEKQYFDKILSKMLKFYKTKKINNRGS